MSGAVPVATEDAAPETGATPGFFQLRYGGGWLVAILLLALLLRLNDMDRMDIWVDEANGILTAKESFATILEKLKRDSSPPLYYFLLHGWMALVGDSPFALRSLSSLFSLALVALVYRIGSREVSRRVGCWAAFLLAISPSQITYSHEARMYTLLPVFALLAWWSLVRYLRSGNVRDFALCMASTSLALYTHNFAIYVPVVLAVLVLISGQLFQRLRMWLLAVVIQALVYAPWLPTFAKQLENSDHYAWWIPFWEKLGILGVLQKSFRSLSPAGSFVMSPSPMPTDLHGIPAVVALVLSLLGVILLIRERRQLGTLGVLWIPIAFWVPLIGALAISQLVTPHYVPGRVDQMLLPAFALLMAVGIAGLSPAWLRRAVAPALLVVSIIGSGVFTHERERPRMVKGRDRDMALAIAAKWRPNDVILFTSLTRAPIEYYLRRMGIHARILNYPRHTARHLGAQNDWRLFNDPKWLMKEAKIVLDAARELTRPDGHLFIVRSKVKVNDALLPGVLRKRFYVFPEAIMGQYVQSGTAELVMLSLNSMHPYDSERSRAPAAHGAEP